MSPPTDVQEVVDSEIKCVRPILLLDGVVDYEMAGHREWHFREPSSH